MIDNYRLPGGNARYILASEGFWRCDEFRIRAELDTFALVSEKKANPLADRLRTINFQIKANKILVTYCSAFPKLILTVP
jgi:hypothetical protein